MVSPSVASATDGAALNNPAKLAGFTAVPNNANRDTAKPPTTKRYTDSSHMEALHNLPLQVNWMIRNTVETFHGTFASY
jgi:hypothetical protein